MRASRALNDEPELPAGEIARDDYPLLSRSVRPRAVRVFVSSTFVDMDAEREVLMKTVFPRLRTLCEERDVAWGEVDLRWGITAEESRQGKVLPICLGEIDRCRPFFLAILGERYGWVPDAIPLELLEREPWLKEAAGRSVTELEILHGALNPASSGARAFFYFRSEAFLNTVPSERRPQFRESGKSDGDVPATAERLRALKARILSSGHPCRVGYDDPRVVGDWVYRDLAALITSEFPEAQPLAPLDRERADHDSFAESLTRVYIDRRKDLARLDAHVGGSGPPLIVTGESGVGKSALLANWARRYLRELSGAAPAGARTRGWLGLLGRGEPRAPRPASGLTQPLVILHFVGAAPRSSDWAALVRRVLEELKRRFAIPMEVPEKAASLPAALSNWLRYAGERGRVVLLIDGLDRLEEREQALEMHWLPTTIPAGVRLVVATAPGRPLQALRLRGWPELQVEPLSKADRRRLTLEYLGQYRKKLAPDQVNAIGAARAAAIPIYLRTLLEELRLFGNHERLPARIKHYLQAPAVDQLYTKVLERFEADYEHERPGLVHDALSALWGSRNGLSEPELLDLLGNPGSPLPGAYWSPLYLALGESLVVRSGLLGFFHPGLRHAVEMRYLEAPDGRRAIHRRLAAYFAGRGMTRRRIEERPWQLAEAGDWSELAAELAEPAFLEGAWPIQPFEIKAAWARIEASGAARIVERHHRILENPDAYPRCIWALAVLLGDTGHEREALALTTHLEAAARSEHDPGRLQASLGLRARLLRDRGEFERALEAMRSQEAVCRRSGDRAALAACLGGQGIVLRDRGDLDAASALFLEEKVLCEDIDDLAGVAANLGHRAIVAALRTSHGEALTLFGEQEAMCRRLGDPAALAEAIGNFGVVLYTLGRFAEADAKHREQEQLCRQLNDWSSLQVCLGHRARIAQEREDYDTALRLLDEQEAILRNRLDDSQALAWALFQQAFLFAERLGQPRHALMIAEEAHHFASQPGPDASRDDESQSASARADAHAEGFGRFGPGLAVEDSPATRTRRQIEALLKSIRDRLG